MAFKSKQVLEWLIAKHPSLRHTGFRKALRESVSKDPIVAETIKGFVPDAFNIFSDNNEVHAIEVVDTCPITFEKGDRLYEFGEAPKDFRWNFSVIAFDYVGGLICHLPSWCFARSIPTGSRGKKCVMFCLPPGPSTEIMAS